VLEQEAVALRATATTLATERTQRWSRNEKLAAVSFGMLNIIINAILLHFTVDGV
jgi:hypothetical protein